jgi:hypothetical protein
MMLAFENVKALPIIMCPACGKHLTLASIVPETDNRQRMTFTCICGFDYRQSSAATAERSL